MAVSSENRMVQAVGVGLTSIDSASDTPDCCSLRNVWPERGRLRYALAQHLSRSSLKRTTLTLSRAGRYAEALALLLSCLLLTLSDALLAMQCRDARIQAVQECKCDPETFEFEGCLPDAANICIGLVQVIVTALCLPFAYAQKLQCKNALLYKCMPHCRTSWHAWRRESSVGDYSRVQLPLPKQKRKTDEACICT